MADPIRLGGFFSTFDTEAVITQLREARMIRAQRLEVESARASVRGELISNISSRFAALLARANTLTTGFSVTGKTAATTGTSVSAAASPNATIGTYSVAVSKLATATRVTGSAITAALNPALAMNRSNFATSPTNGTYTIGRTGGGTTTLTVGAATITNASMLSAANFSTAMTSGTFTVATATGGSALITVDTAMQTLDDVVTAINASGVGVTASITNDANGRANILSLTSTQGAITLGNVADTSNFLTATNLSGSTGTTTRASASAMSQQMTLNDVVTAINGSGVGITASLQNDANGRLNVLSLTAATAIQLGNATDTSNLLAATNVLAAPAGTTRASTQAIARITPSTKMADASWFGGAPAAGAHTMTINGVSISYNAANDSLNDVLGRINASGAGVNARYDPASDTIRFEQSKTGSLAITLAEDGLGGNLLTKMGVIGATQATGQNAEYTIDGGATQYSASNTVNALPGVTMTFAATTDVGSPAVVTVSQNTSGGIGLIKAFVADFNAVLDSIDQATKTDAKNRSNAGELSGDASFRHLRSNLRAFVTGPGIGLGGAFKNLNEIGIGFGSFGAALGTTGQLQFNEAKFSETLARDPAAVQAALSALTVTASLAGGGTSSVSSMTGTYTGTRPGYYKLIDDGIGHITAEFHPVDGGPVTSNVATVVAGGTNTSLIPGVTLQLGPAFQPGEHTVNVTATQSSPLQQLKQILEAQVGAGGVLARRQSSYDAIVKDIDIRRGQIEDRVDREMDNLRRKFAAMEQAQARSQRILSALQQNAARLAGSSGG